MVNTDDPSYIIAEDGYYYVASRHPEPGTYNAQVVTVSSRGVVNGLSEEYNDGCDFGPDTYSPTSTANPPYTQTCGIQEAFNYAATKATYFDDIATGYVLYPIKLLTGLYTLNADVISPSFPNITQDIPVFTLLGEGSGLGVPTVINLNGHNIIIGNSSGEQTFSGGFLIQGLQFTNLTGTGSLQFLGNFSANPQCVLRDLSFTNNVSLDMSGANNFAQLNMDNLILFSQFLSPTKSYQISITNGTFKGGFYSNGVNQIGAVNFAEGIQINSGDPNLAFNVWEIDNNGTAYAGNDGITNGTASGTTSNMTIDVGTLVINTTEPFFNSTGSNGTLNLKLHIKHLVFQTDIMDFAIPSGSGINIEEFTIDEITNNTSSDISTANLPILSSTSGTTAGTVDMRFTEYAGSHKKMIITFSGYENDSTTNQTINFPMPFSSYAVASVNNTGLTITPSTTGITITAPDSTTTYSGIVIVEGY
jgi:hypothetical protein